MNWIQKCVADMQELEDLRLFRYLGYMPGSETCVVATDARGEVVTFATIGGETAVEAAISMGYSLLGHGRYEDMEALRTVAAVLDC